METVRKILIADDSLTIQRVFERTLPSGEFHLFFATDGQEAIEKAREILPHLIIADINMPSKGGMEICEELKKDPKLKEIPVLLLVGVLDDFDEEEGKRAGAAGYLVKPFEAESALSRIREVLAQAPSVEEPPKEEVIELTEVIEEPTFEEELRELPEGDVGPQEVEPEEESFVLETPLRELEKELQEVLKEEEEEKLDLSLEEISFEKELREEPHIRSQETERLEEMLKESVAELEKIEGAPEGASVEEEFVRTFEEEFAPSEPQRSEQKEAVEGLEEALRRFVRAIAEEVVKALSDEIKKVVKEVLEEEVSRK